VGILTEYLEEKKKSYYGNLGESTTGEWTKNGRKKREKKRNTRIKRARKWAHRGWGKERPNVQKGPGNPKKRVKKKKWKHGRRKKKGRGSSTGWDNTRTREMSPAI